MKILILSTSLSFLHCSLVSNRGGSDSMQGGGGTTPSNTLQTPTPGQEWPTQQSPSPTPSGSLTPFPATSSVVSPYPSNSPVITPITGPNPLVVIPGWGHDFLSHQPFLNFVTASGFPADRLHYLPYPYKSTPDVAAQALIQSFAAVKAKYAPQTMFDMVGISTGGFMGLYFVMKGNFDPSVQRFISIVGINHGVDMMGAGAGIYGTLIQTLTPFNNSFVSGFYNQYSARMQRIQKCSLFSPADGLISPYDSGRFADGKNVDLPGLSHADVVLRPDYFNNMQQHCMPPGWPKNP